MNSLTRNLLADILVVIVFVYSGSIFYMSANKDLQLGSLVLVILLTLVCFRFAGIHNLLRVRNTSSIAFLVILAVNIMFNLLLVSSPGTFGLYFIHEFTLYLAAYLISCLITIDLFERSYVQVITALAAISLLLWLWPQIASSIAMKTVAYGDWLYKTSYIYNLNLTVPMRNCGPFWEPGLYQGFLNFGILTVILNKSIRLKLYYIIILSLAVVTTFSSTGYFLLICNLLVWLFRQRGGYKRLAWNVVLVGILIFIASQIGSILTFVNRYTLYSISDKFTDSSNASVATRIYSGLSDLRIALSHPIGIDRAQLGSLRMQASGYNNVTASTNTFTMFLTYFGWLPGLMYSILWVRGSLHRSSTILSRIMIVVMIISILATEPHVDLMFFNVMFFYWNSNVHKKEVHAELVTV